MTLDIGGAAEALGDGKLVAFPTDTVWGLAADATNDEAVADIFLAKGRPILRPLAVLLANTGDAEKLAVFNRPARALARKFWPGALTLVLRRRPSSEISGIVTSGLPTVGLRVPAHPLALDLLAACDAPLAVTSANPSGVASAVSAGEAVQGLGHAAVLVLDGEPAPEGTDSTVVVAEEDGLKILRIGAISAEALAQAVDVPVTSADSNSEAEGEGEDAGDTEGEDAGDTHDR